MKKVVLTVIFFLLPVYLFSQEKYQSMPPPPAYLDSLLVSHGILEIADKVYDNGWIDFKKDRKPNKTGTEVFKSSPNCGGSIKLFKVLESDIRKLR